MPSKYVTKRKPKDPRGPKCHFKPWMRVRACSCFKAAHVDLHRYDIGSIRDYTGRAVAGGSRDPTWDAAFESFVNSQSAHEKKEIPRKTTYKNYKDLVKKWYDTWQAGSSCERASARGSHVRTEELIRIAQLVSQGTEGADGSWSHFSSIIQAADECQEL